MLGVGLQIPVPQARAGLNQVCPITLAMASAHLAAGRPTFLIHTDYIEVYNLIFLQIQVTYRIGVLLYIRRYQIDFKYLGII